MTDTEPNPLTLTGRAIVIAEARAGDGTIHDRPIGERVSERNTALAALNCGWLSTPPHPAALVPLVRWRPKSGVNRWAWFRLHGQVIRWC